MEKSKGQMKSRLSYAAGAFGNDVMFCHTKGRVGRRK